MPENERTGLPDGCEVIILTPEDSEKCSTEGTLPFMYALQYKTGEEPLMFGKIAMYILSHFGTETAMAFVSESNAKAKEGQAAKQALIYLEHDLSLQDDGFDIESDRMKFDTMSTNEAKPPSSALPDDLYATLLGAVRSAQDGPGTQSSSAIVTFNVVNNASNVSTKGLAVPACGLPPGITEEDKEIDVNIYVLSFYDLRVLFVVRERDGIVVMDKDGRPSAAADINIQVTHVAPLDPSLCLLDDVTMLSLSAWNLTPSDFAGMAQTLRASAAADPTNEWDRMRSITWFNRVYYSKEAVKSACITRDSQGRKRLLVLRNEKMYSSLIMSAEELRQHAFACSVSSSLAAASGAPPLRYTAKSKEDGTAAAGRKRFSAAGQSTRGVGTKRGRGKKNVGARRIAEEDELDVDESTPAETDNEVKPPKNAIVNYDENVYNLPAARGGR